MRAEMGLDPRPRALDLPRARAMSSRVSDFSCRLRLRVGLVQSRESYFTSYFKADV